jgi:hypothetical protein
MFGCTQPRPGETDCYEDARFLSSIDRPGGADSNHRKPACGVAPPEKYTCILKGAASADLGKLLIFSEDCRPAWPGSFHRANEQFAPQRFRFPVPFFVKEDRRRSRPATTCPIYTIAIRSLIMLTVALSGRSKATPRSSLSLGETPRALRCALSYVFSMLRRTETRSLMRQASRNRCDLLSVHRQVAGRITHLSGFAWSRKPNVDLVGWWAVGGRAFCRGA